jgi:chromosome segregation ATPase
MDNLTTSKIFSSNFFKYAEEDFEFSVSSKKSSVRSVDSEDNQFSFSFNHAGSDSKPLDFQKVAAGFGRIKWVVQEVMIVAFKRIRSACLLVPAARGLVLMFMLKQKRAGFIKWYVQSIKLASEVRVQSALSTVSQLNSFSRRYISCSLIFNLFNKNFLLVGQTLLNRLSVSVPDLDSYSKTSKSKTSAKLLQQFRAIDDSKTTANNYIFKGLFFLGSFIQNKSFSLKSRTFKCLSNDLSLQRQAFIQNTDRCIQLSEQLFQAKESKEKAEFEKEEILAVLESKTEELNKLMDVVEEYKTWKGKLSHLESSLNEEVSYWKSQTAKVTSDLDKKNKEIIEVYSDKKKAEEECLKAYRNLDAVQKENRDLINISSNSKEQECEKCERFKLEIATYEELVEEFKKNEEKLMNNVRELQELLSRPASAASNVKARAKQGKKPVKRTLELEKQSITENETQLAVEIVNLNKSLTKFKHENKTLGEILKKCQVERDELKRLMIGKDEALNRLRKENEQLCLSLSTDHYKSVHKLEHAHSQTEQKILKLQNDLSDQIKANDDLRQDLKSSTSKIQDLQSELQIIQTTKTSSKDHEKLSETLQNLQVQFLKLKEMSDKQIQTIESLKQDNFQLMQSVESFKSLARSNKLHADKASSDAETYSNLIKKMESELLQMAYAKDSAEKEANSLKSHLMKLLSKS